MGHERIGFLPKTIEWQNIMQQLSCFDGNDEVVKQISFDTLKAVNATYNRLIYDESLNKCIYFLATISVSANQTDQISFLQSQGFNIPESGISTYTLVSNANKMISTEYGSLEVNKIARDAITQAIIEYGKKEYDNKQISIFDTSTTNVWSEIGTGSAFCEIARSFISSFTDRQLRYYLERTAADSINNYTQYNLFLSQIRTHTSEISYHAFETSKLVQSFSAGWFNKYARDKLPSADSISTYLRVSLSKMREEFRREAEGT